MKTIQELIEMRAERPIWLCNPYVVQRGITFLHGKTSIGKSPLTWELARCVSQGIPFLGFETTRSRVLYIEADSAEVLMQDRVQHLPLPYGKWQVENLAGRTLDLLRPDSPMWADLYHCQREWIPDLVIWNTLRQLYQGSGNDAEVVPRVYSAMYKAFPQAGHVIVGHDRKSSKDDGDTPESEMFSGSAAWRDLATIGLHLLPLRVEPGRGTHLRLKHTKSQVSEPIEPIDLLLLPDGTRLETRHDRDAKVHEAWAQAPSTGDKGAWVAATLGISRSTVMRARARLQGSGG